MSDLNIPFAINMQQQSIQYSDKLKDEISLIIYDMILELY